MSTKNFKKEISVDKSECLNKFKDVGRPITDMDTTWNEYTGELEGSEILRSYYETTAKFQTLISLFKTMVLQDFGEIRDIYDTYCKLDDTDNE